MLPTLLLLDEQPAMPLIGMFVLPVLQVAFQSRPEYEDEMPEHVVDVFNATHFTTAAAGRTVIVQQITVAINRCCFIFLYPPWFKRKNDHLDSAKMGNKKARKSRGLQVIKKPPVNGGLFSAFIYSYFTLNSGAR